MARSKVHADDCFDLRSRLLEVHRQLWDAKDDIKQCNAQEDFGARFVSAARRVDQLNEQRLEIILQIDVLYGHALEVKECTSSSRGAG